MNRLHELWQELGKERLWLGALLCFAMGLVLGARAGWSAAHTEPGPLCSLRNKRRARHGNRPVVRAGDRSREPICRSAEDR